MSPLIWTPRVAHIEGKRETMLALTLRLPEGNEAAVVRHTTGLTTSEVEDLKYGMRIELAAFVEKSIINDSWGDA